MKMVPTALQKRWPDAHAKMTVSSPVDTTIVMQRAILTSVSGMPERIVEHVISVSTRSIDPARGWHAWSTAVDNTYAQSTAPSRKRLM